MYDDIVIAVDGSDEAKQAARHGLKLAQVFGATVDILHVIEQNALSLTQTADEKMMLRDRGESILSEIERLALERDLPCNTTLTEGKPAIEICEYATAKNAGLIVVGRQGLTGMGRYLLGGITEQILHRSDVPVFVVPRMNHTSEQDTGYSRILIPTDGTENAENAIPHGVAIAENYDSDIHTLNVVDLYLEGGMFDAGGLEKEFVARLDQRGQEAVDGVADTVRETAADVEVVTDVEHSTSHKGAAIGICEYVKENQINLIVMGSHGQSNLRRQLLGSVASTVLRTVDVPVLIVKRTL